MSLLSKSELNRIVGQSYRSETFSKAVTDSIRIARADPSNKYDIFLSHSYLDKETILQLNYILEEMLNFKVYVDWIENPDLDRSQVNNETALELRSVMDRSTSLLYAISANAASSKWMPWELGYSDARHGRVAVLPISDYETTSWAYKDQEFISLYPYVDIENNTSGDRHLWVIDPSDPGKYTTLRAWHSFGVLPKHTP
jgi:hypothetical protein